MLNILINFIKDKSNFILERNGFILIKYTYIYKILYSDFEIQQCSNAKFEKPLMIDGLQTIERLTSVYRCIQIFKSVHSFVIYLFIA